MTGARVTALYVYPVKSTGARALDSAAVEPRGIANDRRFMVVNSAGDFINGREHPLLTRVFAAVDGAALTLSSDEAETVSVPLAAPDAAGTPVAVWGERCTGVRLERRVDEWLSALLGVECALVQMTDACRRPVDPHFGEPGDEVSYADGFPLLLIAQSSLTDLNSRLDAPVSMRRFRPNVVVSGCDAFAEDGWRRLRIGDVELDGVKACSRCVFTTVDPDTAEKHPRGEPLRTLATFRRRPEGGVYFGQNLIPRTIGEIRVGDAVEVMG